MSEKLTPEQRAEIRRQCSRPSIPQYVGLDERFEKWAQRSLLQILDDLDALEKERDHFQSGWQTAVREKHEIAAERRGQISMKTTLTREAKQANWRDRALKAEARCEQLETALIDAQTFLHAAQKNYTVDWATADRIDAALAASKLEAAAPEKGLTRSDKK